MAGGGRDQDARRIARQLAHPRDRKVRQLEKRHARAERVSAQAERRKQEKERALARLLWFREQCVALGYTTAAVPRALWLPLVRLFIRRNDAEVAALKAMRNPPQGRIRQLEHMAADEEAELRSAKGFEIPRLDNADEVEILTTVWDGLQETACVLNKAHVTLENRGKPTEAEVAATEALAARLKPIEEVRAAAAAVLPRRAREFSERGRDHMASAKRAAAGKGAGRKVSVKSLGGGTGEDLRQRTRDAAQRKQQSHLKKMRKAALEARRSG